MLERTDLRTSTVMEYVAVILIFTLTCGVSCTNDIPGGSGDSVKGVHGVPSDSQSTMPTSVVLPATAVPSIGRIRHYFQNRAKNGPQISNLVTRVKQRYSRPRLQWRRAQRNSAMPGLQRMMGVQPTGRFYQMRNHPNPYSPGPRSRIGYRNQRLARDDQRSASAAQGRSSGDVGGASVNQPRSGPNAGNNKQVSVRINAMKNPRLNNRRWVRLGPYQPRYLYPMVYPHRWIPTIQNSQARRNPASETAEALAMLTQKLSRMEASMARLKEAIVLQGAAHLQSAEKLEAMMAAQAEVNTRNGKDTRDILLTVKRCCACSARRGEALRRSNAPSAVVNSLRSPHQSKRDFVPPLIHMKRNDHGHHSIGVKYSSSKDQSGAQEPDGQDNNDLGRETTEPAMIHDHPEQTSIRNGDSQSPHFVKRSTPKFKHYAIINVTGADGNITEVIQELHVQKPGANGGDTKPEHTMKEEMLTTGTPDTSTPIVLTGGIYGYAAAYRLKSDHLLMHSSRPIPLGSTATQNPATKDETNTETTNGYRNGRRPNSATNGIDIKPEKNIPDEDDSNSIYNKDVESPFLHTSTQTSEGITESASTSVQQEMITDTAKTDSEFTSVTTTTITPEATTRPDEPEKSSSPSEQTTLQTIIRTLSYWHTEDEKGTRSPVNPKSSPQSLAPNVDVVDTTKNAESEDIAENQHHNTGSEVTTAVKEEGLPEATTERQSLEEAEDAATVGVLGTVSTPRSPRPLRRQSEQQMTTASAPKEIATKPKEEPGPLQVDFSSGDIQNDGMPGVTWIVRPSPPGPGQSRRLRRSTKPRRRSWGRRKPPHLSALSDCSLQGVLKFTFTPPPLKSPTANPRHRHHRHHRGKEEEEEKEGGGRDGGGGRRRKLMLNFEVWKPSQWVFNLGDSIANNGFSGDGSVQENDCETQGYGQSFAIYASDKHPDGRKKLLRAHNGFLIDNVTLIISDQTLQWNNHHGNQGTLTHASLFALSGQSDNQGPVNYDVYLGLNRVIDGSYRSGHGLCRLSAQWLT